MRVGFVGLGDIGAPMAQQLAARFHVSVWARRREATEPVVGAGAHAVDDLADLGACDVVGICVSDDGAVRSVVDGLVTSLGAGTILCIHSTVHPSTVTEVAEQIAAAGGGTVDAPVSGGPDAAAAGRLQLMVGGAPEHVDRAREMLSALGEIRLMGGLGSGQRTKLINNALYAAHLALARDVVAIAEAHGLEPDKVIDALSGGSGASFALRRLSRNLEPSRAPHVGWLLGKDLALFDDAVDSLGTRISSLARQFVESLGDAGSRST